MEVRIGQLNARQSLSVWTALGIAAGERGLDVVLIQDPPFASVTDLDSWKKEMEGIMWAGYKLVSAGAIPCLSIIVAKACIQSRPCAPAGPRVCGASLAFREAPLVVWSAYIRHTTGDGADELSRALESSQRESPYTFVGMDSNGHSSLWGPEGTRLDRVGELVEGVLGENGLLVVNSQESPPTFFSDAGSRSWIDISAASPALIPSVADWEVLDSVEVLSDHRLVETRVSGGPRRAMVRETRNWTKVDWHAFNQQLLLELDASLLTGEIIEPEHIDHAVVSITGSLQRTIEEVVPKRRICQYSRAGWTPELTELRQKAASARRRWIRTGRVSARETFLRTRRLFRDTLRQARIDAWRRLCEKATTPEFWALYRRVRHGGGSKGVEVLHSEDRSLVTDEEKSEALAKVFFPDLPAATVDHQRAIDAKWRARSQSGSDEGVQVAPGEIVSAIRRMRVGGAPGRDGIPARVYRKCMLTILPWLVVVFSASLRSGYFPEEWRTARVLALRKPGKTDYTSPRSYRPISLLSVMGKLLESIVNRRLMRSLESRCLLSPYQFGFRAGREVLGACSRLADDVVQAFRCRQQVQAVALDIQAAYDTVWQNGLLEKMERLGVDSYLVQWVRGFLSDRVSHLEVGESSLLVRPGCGVPQGSTISPTLFLIYIDDLLQRLRRVWRVRRQAFADDLSMWIRGQFRRGLIHGDLQRALDLVERWADFWRMQFSVRKCECILFREKRVHIDQDFEARLNGELIPHVKELRYLGVWFDQSLTWRKQVEVAVSRARARLWLLRRMGGRDWGLDPYLFLRLVRGVVVPLMFFGAPCWASVLSSSTRLAQFDSVLACAARMAFRLERNTSSEAALALAGLAPARMHILRLLVRYLMRRRGAELMAPLSGGSRRTRVTPMELGHTWFHRSVLGKTLSDPPPVRRRLVHEGIERALRGQWRSRWRHSETGAALREVLPSVGAEWRTEDEAAGSRFDITLAARLFTGHCHIASFRMPWDEDEWEPCPWCGDDFTRSHMLWECRGLAQERVALLRGVRPQRIGDLGWFARVMGSRVGQFTRAAGRLIESSAGLSNM